MLQDGDYKTLLESIHERYGYDFVDYNESSLKRRIERFMEQQNIGTIRDLERTVLADEHLFEAFVQEMSVTVTEMFRDPNFYKKIREVVVPRLTTYPFIKIWIAGCATGQEIYSLAILLKEEGIAERTLIYATDINQKSMAIAREGVYGLDHMQLYTSNYQKAGGKRAFSEYYQAKYGRVIFDQSLKNNVVFSVHNLVTDQSFNEFQMIICRNVLMYFNQTLQDRVLDLFYKSLCPFGFLGLGDKESLVFYKQKDRFEEIARKEKLYRKST